MPPQSRTFLACDTCRRRKIRCDSIRPTCGNCSRSNLACTYIPTERQSTIGSRFALIIRRLERIEQCITTLKPLADPRRVALLDQLLESQKSLVLGSNNQESIEGHLQNENSGYREEPIDRIDMNGAAPFFNDRLEQLKAHTCGANENSSVYTSSVFLSIFSSADIEMLSRHLNDSALPQRLEIASNRMWKMNQQIIARLIEMPDHSASFDERFISYFRRSFLGSNSGFLHYLLHQEDLDNQNQLPDFLQNGISAALIILTNLEIQLTANFSLFPRPLVQQQKKLALHCALKTLSHIRFSMPRFISVRISTLLLWLLSVGSTVPSTFQFLLPTIQMAQAIGIDKFEINDQYPQAEARCRTQVWNLLVHFQYILSASLSKSPILSPEACIGDFTQENDEVFKYMLGIEKLYYEVRNRLFALPSKRFTRDMILKDILCFIRDVERWRSQVPKYLWDDVLIHPKSCDLETWMYYAIVRCMKSMHDHTLLAIHSIPAFLPDYLPKRVTGSLDIVTQCARNLLRTAVYAEESKNAWTTIPSACVTAALGTMLYKQIRHPQCESNTIDIEILQRNVTSFMNCQDWPMTDSEIPLKLLWQLLLEILIRLHNVEGGPENSRRIPEYFGNALDEDFLDDFDKDIFDMPSSELRNDCNII